MPRLDDIEQAFGQEPALYQRILEAQSILHRLDADPQNADVFQQIATYHLNTLPNRDDNDDGPASKKRKLPNGASLPIHSMLPTGPRTTIIEFPELSFSLPQRKRLDFGIYHYASSNSYTLGAKVVDKDEMVFEMRCSEVGMAMKMLVPEKAQRAHNYVLLPKGTGEGVPEAVVFTKAADIESHRMGKEMPESIKGAKGAMLEAALKLAGIKLVEPSVEEFASAIPEAHRKGEKAFHVKAHRGSKDGFLFFLSTGIFFGFKKPLFFVGLEGIESISFTNILTRTFDMVVEFREGEEVQEVVFGMIDTAEYAGINGFVGRQGLNDASLAEGRRARIKPKAKAETNGTAGEGEGDEDDDGRTELEKAEAQLQDEEDEMEDDFELDSDDEDSEGSGGSDDENESGDLVHEELGSEAEDVDDDEEEEEVYDEADEEEEEQPEKPQAVTQPPRVHTSAVFPPGRSCHPDPDDDDQL